MLLAIRFSINRYIIVLLYSENGIAAVALRPATFIPIFKLLIFNTYVYGQVNSVNLYGVVLRHFSGTTEAKRRDSRRFLRRTTH